MPRSIRWRLVLSYMLLAFGSVAMVGWLTLALIDRRLEAQEVDYLTANAEAIARQAALSIEAGARTAELEQLAGAAAFLGDVQVRILDEQGSVLVDSGAPSELQEMAWIVPPPARGRPAGREAPPLFLFDQRGFAGLDGLFPFDPRLLEELMLSEWGGTLEDPLSDMLDVIVVQRSSSPWGDLLDFEYGLYLDDADVDREPASAVASPSSAGSADDMTADGAGEETAAIARSTQTVTLPILVAGSPAGFVELSNGPDFGAESLETVRRAFLIAATGVALLAAFLGLLMSRSLTGPLQALTGAAAQMHAGDLGARAPVRSRDEIGALAGQFNQMADEMQRSFAELEAERDALRRFIADASHELRTPITALRTFNDLLQGPAAHDAAAQQEFLQESAAQIVRLEWITANLLDLSRLDAGLVDLELGEIDLAELIHAVVAPFRLQAQEAGIALTVTVPPDGITLRGDRARLAMALANLLDNACKFTPRGGEIVVNVQQQPEAVELSVADTGPGLNEEDLPLLFERFYRSPASGKSGSGLGLAIVQSIVQAHGGTVRAANRAAGGSVFTLSLPAA